MLALIIGKRVGFMRDPMRPHNLTLTMIGAGLLWFGWYGFNVGSIVFTSDSLKSPAKFSAQFYAETGVTFMNTTLATMAAMLAWLLDRADPARQGHLAGCRVRHRGRVWSRSRRPVARSTSSARSSSAPSPVASAPARSG